MALAHSPRIVTDGLVLALDAANIKSYPGSGEIWYDLSGNGYNATRTNNSGYGGQVIHNSSGYWDFTVNTPTTGNSSTQGNGFTLSALPIPRSGSFTLSSFIRRDHTALSAGGRETIFGNAGGANGWRYGISNTGLIYYLISGETEPNQEGNIGSGYDIGDGVWHMVTSVYDRAAELGTYTIYAYVDGVEVGSVAINNGATANEEFSAGNPGVGYGGCCAIFGGFIAQLSAYNRALSASEVSQNFNAIRGRFGI